MSVEPDPYTVLGVLPTVDETALLAVYRALLKKFHPDVFPGPKAEAECRTRAIIHAYEILSDPVRRKIYDVAFRSRASEPPKGQRGYSNDFEINWASYKNASPKYRSKKRTCVAAALVAVLVLTLAWLGNQ